MKWQRFVLSVSCFFISSFCIIQGCSSPILKIPKSLPSIVKEYKHITLTGNQLGMRNTGIYLDKGDFYSILVGDIYKRSCLTGRIEGEMVSIEPYYSNSTVSGYLYLGHNNLCGETFVMGIDMIIWEKEDYDQIVQFLEKMKEKDPNNDEIISALSKANRYKTIQLASKKTTQEIKETKEKIEELKSESGGLDKDKKIAQLEKKFSNLMNTLKQLDDLKKQLREERMRTDLLNEKLAKVMKEKETLKEKLESAEDVKQELGEEKKRAEILGEKLDKVTKEKEVLKVKLESESDVKRQLEDSLKEKELALKRQEELVASLYEKERQLKSKLFQLEQAKGQSEENRMQLERLKNRAEEINKGLREKKEKDTTAVKEELDRIFRAKSKLEFEAENLKGKESRLREEVSALNATAEKMRLEAEDAKKELDAKRKRETELVRLVDELKKRLNRRMAPVLVVSKPQKGSKIESSTTMLHIIAVDDRGLIDIAVSLNGEPVKLEMSRGIKVTASHGGKVSKKIDLTKRLQLQYGQNTIRVSVTDTDGISTKEIITVTREKEQGKIWAVVIGINQYQDTRNLKYAVNDARAFKNYLKEYIGIPDDNIFFLTDEAATKIKIEGLMGTKIRRMARKDDTVIIFYAGHGAVETDPLDPDGDGLEKYLLPHDARLDDLYSTSIAMADIKTIFQRIHAERLIFIADTCYSGASGGRTMLASKSRATLSEKFFERISKGKGRVILSASSANEVSKEDDYLKHGIFSYYLLEGLKGKADHDGDGIITVSELFSFLSRKVPEASGQDQHPVRKGETEGELVIGRVK